MFTILLGLKDYFMEERDKICFMCRQNVELLVVVLGKEIEGI